MQTVPQVVRQLRVVNILVACVMFALVPPMHAQVGGQVEGEIFDPSGARIQGASITLTQNGTSYHGKSDHSGHYSFQSVQPGLCDVIVTSPGFAQSERDNISVERGRITNVEFTLSIDVAREEVQVPEGDSGVGTGSDGNASAMILKGADLNALSDDPDQLNSELQALAGPGVGGNGTQIYVDGFLGGRVPPKSSIRELRVNQNPYSAEFEQPGFGRIQILTKPGSAKLSGSVSTDATQSALNTGNPLVSGQPSYYQYFVRGDLTGPVRHGGAFFVSILDLQRQNQNAVIAINPSSPTSSIRESVPNPSSLLEIDPRFDLQLGHANTLSIRDSYMHTRQSGSGIGALNLSTQGYSLSNDENDLQLSNTTVIGPHLLNEQRVQWRHISSSQVASSSAPTVVVQGAFTGGGNNLGRLQDRQDDVEIQDTFTEEHGNHTSRFGILLRTYHDVNTSTSGANSKYIFTDVSSYIAKAPSQYQVTVISNPTASITLLQAAAFAQTEWRVSRRLTVSPGIRYQVQTHVRDYADWAPRMSLAWQLSRGAKPKHATVLRAGYGWFYNQLTVPSSLVDAAGSPYLIQAIHQNGVNEQSYTLNNPSFYNPASPVTSLNLLQGASTNTVLTVAPNFRAALTMQSDVGLDYQIRKDTTVSVSYLHSQGIHQFLTNNVSAPMFDPSTYTVSGAQPLVYRYQYQSRGVFRQDQFIVSATARLLHLAIHSTYTMNFAKSNTQGITSFPSSPADLDLDYGRATFDIRHQLLMTASYQAPFGIMIAPYLAAQSGTPFNVTVGEDLTATNQFNARPTYGQCGVTKVVRTIYGCLNSDPVGKGEKIVPFNLGTGPANAVFNLRASKTFMLSRKQDHTQAKPSGSTQPLRRQESLTFLAGAFNLFNLVNRGAPNGVLLSPLFGTSQSLATGPFASPSAGNRTIFLQARFNF